MLGWLLFAGAPFWSVPVAPQAPDTVLGPLLVAPASSGPAVVVREQPGIPLVALRLSVPIHEAPASAGATRVLARLGWAEIEAEAARHGARVEFERLPAHAVYRVTGPARSFRALVSLLRRAIDAPRRTSGRVEAVRFAVRAEALAQLEIPAQLVRQRLRTSLFPALLPGARATATAVLTPDQLQAFWSRTFQPERMHVVVVGGVNADSVIPAFRGWPAPAPVMATTPTRPSPTAVPATPVPATAADTTRQVGGRRPRNRIGSLAPPNGRADTATMPITEAQALSRWAGVGYPAAGVDPATVAVVAALLRQRLPELGLRGAGAEFWWMGGSRALVVVAAEPVAGDGTATTMPGGDPVSLSQRLRTFVAETVALLEPAQVVGARRMLRRDVLFAARAPQGFSEVVGRFVDRTGEPAGAEHFLDALAAVEVTRVRAAMLDLLLGEPVVVELRP